MKIRILSTGEVVEVNESRARRMTDMGYAVREPEKAKKAAKAEVEVTDKLPEAAEEVAAEEKPAKGKKSK